MPLVTVVVDSARVSAVTAPPMARERIIHAAARATRMRFGRLRVAATLVGFMGSMLR